MTFPLLVDILGAMYGWTPRRLPQKKVQDDPYCVLDFFWISRGSYLEGNSWYVKVLGKSNNETNNCLEVVGGYPELRATYIGRGEICGAERVHVSRHHLVRFPSYHRLPPCFHRNQHPYMKSFSFLLPLPPASWYRSYLPCTPTYVYIIATL